MSAAYEVKTITGPHMRMSKSGEVEKYYTVKAQSAQGVGFEAEVPDAQMDAKTVGPMLEEKAKRLDAVTKLGGA